MFIHSTAPWRFEDGQVLDPNLFNENSQYLVNAYDFATSRRYAHSEVSFPFYVSSTLGYTDGYAAEESAYRLPAATDMWITGIFVDGATASGSVDVNLTDVATGLAPAGVSNPLATVSTTEAFQEIAHHVHVPEGSVFKLAISSTGSFTTSKLDVSVHLRTDRFTPDGYDALEDLNIPALTERTLVSSVVFNGIVSNTDVIAEMVQYDRALKASFYVIHNFNSTTPAAFRTFRVPRTGDRCEVVRIDTFCEYASAGGVSDSITWALKTEASASTSISATASMSGQTLVHVADEGSVDLHGSAGIETTAASDYLLVVSSATSVLCLKSYCLVWIK